MKLKIALLLTFASFSAFCMTEADFESDASLQALDYEFYIALSNADPLGSWELKTKKSIILSNLDNSEFKCKTQLTNFQEAGANLTIALNREIKMITRIKQFGNFDAYLQTIQLTESVKEASHQKFEELLECI